MNNIMVAKLETHIDFLETEISYLNDLLVRVGFPEGIATLKETALELLNDPRPFENTF